MPNKLTANDIVKALECCKSDTALCNECPYDKIGECIEKMCADSIDLINRLQAENKRLSTLAELGNTRANDYRVMRDRALKAEAENEDIKFLYENLKEEHLETIKAIKYHKAEAYKEFAELLHCQCESIINQPHNENVRPISWKVAYEEFDEKIDNLLKEMVGE